MAEFTTKCPHCNIELVADEDWIGMELECPSCEQTFTVAKEAPKIHKLSIPQIKPITPGANANDENAENSFTFVCPECGTQVELPIVLKGKKYECKACCEEAIAEPATEKKCPHCGEMIKIQAKVCKHCKKNVCDISNEASKKEKEPLSDDSVIKAIDDTPVNINSNKEEELIFFDTPKNLAIAIVLSILLGSGLGHIYIGQAVKGLAIFFASAFIWIIALAMGSTIGNIICIAFVVGSIIDLVMAYKKLEKGLGVKEWEFFAK